MKPNRRLLLFAALAAGLFFLLADPFLSPPDSACYWSWGESLVRDGDFAFLNQFARFEMPVRYTYITETGRLANDWPPGSGFLLGPWVLIGPMFAHAWVLMVVAGALAFWARGAGFSPAATRWGLLAAIAGTPLAFYVFFGPFFSHALSFAVVTVFLVLWDRTRGGRPASEAALLGLLLGVATAIRPQNALLAAVFLAEVPGWWRGRTWSPRTVGAWMGAGALGVVPLLLAYWALYGSPLALPKTEEMHWLRPALGRMLFSDFHGVLPWTPVYVLVVAGLALLARRDRMLAAALGLVLALQVYVNAANVVWWSGGSFGNRRLTDYAIVAAWGIAELFRAVENRPRPQRHAVLAAIALCCVWSVWLLLAERRLIVPLDRYVPLRGREFAAGMLRVWSEPFQTLQSVARGPWTAAGIARRTTAALLAGAGTAAFLALAARLRRSHAPRVMGTGLVLAGVLALATAVAALRTPPVEDPELIAAVGTEPGILWDNYIELAFYELRRGDFVASEEAARRALAIWDDNDNTWVALGRALFYQKRWISASDAFDRALAINPESRIALDYRSAASARIAEQTGRLKSEE